MDRVNFASHRHPLNRKELLSREERGVCGLCGEDVTNESAYECSQCNFIAHLGCAENPPSLVMEENKIHEHPLTLLPREVSFTCNVCGLSGDKSPYVCLVCNFMIHKDCVEFPRLIRIIRHYHRLSRTFFLGPGEWNCGVCRRYIDGKYGAYCCMKGCESYAVHSRCALRSDVWDGKELLGVPEEEDYEDIAAFSLVGDNSIVHFSHPQHALIRENKVTRDVICSACSSPVAFTSFYRCIEHCGFYLHERCAYLPRVIESALHPHQLFLSVDNKRSDDPKGLSRCNACKLHFNGYRYRCPDCDIEFDGRHDIEFDVRCPSVKEPFDYHLHSHPLFFNLRTNTMCTFCNQHESKYLLNCNYCEFNLCMACATLPREVIYKYDEHLISQTAGEDATINSYWCDICENEIEDMKSYYKCSDCGPVLHTECAVGSFRNMRPGFSFVTQHGHKYEVILNDRISQLRCIQCHKDCHEPLLLMSTTTTTTDVTIYLCSSLCFDTYVSV